MSDDLERWLASGSDTTVGGLIALFGEKSFAVLFVLLLCVPALPLPTGGATHVFEAIAMLLALQLLAGRSEIWLPRRWRSRQLAETGNDRAVRALLKVVRALERVARPALAVVLLSVAVLLEDAILVLVAVFVGTTGIALEFALGRAAINALQNLL